MTISPSVFIDFSDVGYEDFIEVDRVFMNYQLQRAQRMFDEIDHERLLDIIEAERSRLVKEAVCNGITAKYIGDALLYMSLAGLLGYPVPNHFTSY